MVINMGRVSAAESDLNELIKTTEELVSMMNV